MSSVDGNDRATLAGSTITCAFGDPVCPCQDGDVCHYVDDPETGTKAMTPPCTYYRGCGKPGKSCGYCSTHCLCGVDA